MLLFILPMCGCSHTKTHCHTRGSVSGELMGRTGHDIAPYSCPNQNYLPPQANIDDGLTADEAVAIALWNNAAFQELLTQLGISQAQFFDSQLWADPEFIIFFPLGPKQLEFSVFQAISEVWVRPVRIRAAQMDLCQVSEQMVQNGLNLIRDVRFAHAELLFAQERAQVADDAEEIRIGIAKLAQRRLDAGDISELEEITTRVDSLQAKADLRRMSRDTELAQNRLRVLMGLPFHNGEIVAVSDRSPELLDFDPVELQHEALAMRPDLRAAELALSAASQRVKLAKRQFMRLDGFFDANGQGRDGFESGPGLRMTLPLWNRNRGKVAIAQAQYEQALRQYTTIRDQITLDVRNAATQAAQAAENLELIQDEILPTLDVAISSAQKAYEAGGADYFLVLQTTSQFIDARARESRLAADYRQAIAELERSIGHRVTTPVTDETTSTLPIETSQVE